MNSLNFHEKTLTHGLKNIGYSPAEAIADLIDNSIEAKAKNIEIFLLIIVKKNQIKII